MEKYYFSILKKAINKKNVHTFTNSTKSFLSQDDQSGEFFPVFLFLSNLAQNPEYINFCKN
jgi:hypothetical protein